MTSKIILLGNTEIEQHFPNNFFPSLRNFNISPRVSVKMFCPIGEIKPILLCKNRSRFIETLNLMFQNIYIWKSIVQESLNCSKI